MAEGATAGAALSVVVNKLTDLLIQKIDFLRGVKDDVEWLKRELQMMQSFLKDASHKQAKDDRVRQWIYEIRQLAQDAEDVIESFALRVDARQRRRGLMGRCVRFPQHVNHLDRSGKKILSIRNRVTHLREMRETYGIQHLNDEAGPSKKRVAVERRRRVFPWHTSKHVVGLDGDVKTLLERAIFVKKECLSMASIIGMGGSGKSTLAKEVYNHKKVVAQFECRAWITVSQDFRPKELMKAMLKQLRERNDEGISAEETEEELMEMVHQRLKEKQYLVVVDDVWDSDHWEHLTKAFPDNQGKASRLLITSRMKNILRKAVYIHEMKALNSDQSWQLFLKAAFNDDNDGKCPSKLESIGREILKYCGGLPLAIIVMGGLLLERGQTVSEWEKVRKRIKSHSLESKDSVGAVLELSYENLPPYLQFCFLCLGITREDVPISARRLVLLWIAQGVVQSEGEQTMEEMAMSYLGELINRNMLQATYVAEDGGVLGCQIHDLLLDLSIKKAKEEINLDIIREENSSGDLVKARHLAVYYNREKFMSLQCPNPHVRALIFHCLDRFQLDEDVSYTYKYWKSFQGLRLLSLKYLNLKEVPKSIGKMIGLRYLDLEGNKIRKLPKSLGCLKNLQTLLLAENKQLKIPNVLWKLTCLLHLSMSEDMTCDVPLKLDTLKNLHTLEGISTNNIVVEQLKELNNLRYLDVYLSSDDDLSKIFTSLGTLKNLFMLFLRWNHARCLSLDGIANLKHLTVLVVTGPLEKLPKLPGNLLHLLLLGTRLKEDPMPILEMLPELLSLLLDVNAYSHEKMVIGDNGYPSLKSFNIDMLQELKILQIGSNAMPKLNKLVIKGCPLMEILPQQEKLRLMANLQELSWR